MKPGVLLAGLVALMTIGGMLIGGGMWLGTQQQTSRDLQRQIDELRNQQHFYHGEFPKGAQAR